MSIRIPLPTPTAHNRQAARVPLGLPVARAPMVTAEDGRGAALGGLANALSGTADMLHGQEVQRLKEARAAQAALNKEQSIARISKTVSDSALHWTQTLQQMQDEAPAGAPDFTPTVLKAFDDYTQKALADVPDTDRAALTEALTNQRTKLGTAALAFEAGKQREHLVGLYSEGAQADAATLALNPSGYAQTRALRLAALEASNLPVAVRADLKDKTEAALAQAAGAAMTGSDPRGFEWIGQLDAAKRLQLRSQAQGRVDALENQAHIAAARREQAAAGALTAYTRQLALGVPPRAEDLNQWTELVKGSEHEAEFNRLQQGYAQVQALFAKPVAEQLQALQAMQTRLQTEGGNAQDVARVQRAETALAANMQMLTQDPLQWAQQFAGVDMQALDVSLLASEEGAQQYAAILSARAHTIAALRQTNPGVAIADTLLAPQEAAQIVQGFEQSNASEAGQMLAALLQVIGPDNVARQDAIFAQLQASGAGDAQELVRIAALAADPARAIVESNTSSADRVQSGAEAARTVLHGRDILRANGQMKDGPHYKLPKDTDFMAEVVKKVGAAYGSPIPGDSGYEALLRDAQIVKQWYVGEAARTGKLDEDLDTSLLKQAIRAAVGEVVDFNGHDKVVMPRGMDEARFVRHANLAIEESLQAEQLWTYRSDAADYGLITEGGGRYMVTLGGAPTGVVIQVDPNDTARDRAIGPMFKGQPERVRQRLPRSRSRYLQAQDDEP